MAGRHDWTSQGLEEALAALEEPARRCLELAHASFLAGGLAVGAVMTDAPGRIVAEGRNRAYDPPGGHDVLQGSPLAHAEMNVLAAIEEGRPLERCTIWTSQEPCSMCTAAASFTGVGTIRYLAPDPWATATGRSRTAPGSVTPVAEADGAPRILGPAPDRWLVTANVMFLASIARSRGLDHPTVERNREIEPETARVVVDLVGGLEGGPANRSGSFQAFLAGLWDAILLAAAARATRVAGDVPPP